MDPDHDSSRHESPSQFQSDSEEDFLSSSHSFVVRIFLESASAKQRPAEWRGSIREAKSEGWHAVRDLAEIVNYIVPYLKRMGVDVDFE